MTTDGIDVEFKQIFLYYYLFLLLTVFVLHLSWVIDSGHKTWEQKVTN